MRVHVINHLVAVFLAFDESFKLSSAAGAEDVFQQTRVEIVSELLAELIADVIQEPIGVAGGGSRALGGGFP